MTTSINTQGGFTRLATAIGGAVAALFLAAFAAVLMPAAAHADANLIQYSADNSTWGGTDQIPALQGTLIPGGEATSKFWAKNTTATGGTLQVYLGNWTKNAPDVQAYVRAEINDATGGIVNLVQGVAEPGTELQSIHLAPGQSAKVLLVVGMPTTAGNESQNASVDPNFTIDFEVDPAGVATTTTVTGPATATTGVAANLTATVTPAEATGTVQFRDGTTDLGGPVTVTNGTATLAHTFTTQGARSITAVYSGAAGFETSTSAAFTVTVGAPALGQSSVTLTVPATAFTSAGVQLKAVVAPADATGTIQFKDGTKNIGIPKAVVGGVVELTNIFPTAGDHVITAVYSGDATHAGATSDPKTITITDPAPGGNTGSAGSVGSIFGS
ncbi:Ig-like domain-containing protein [Rhodococcus sp. NPDC127528]|uniref:Ig-like domain-containing protein n=1 Tax=unclassified Rhodococcus (in: high G+C Gram-positive bacteria) TaxID=192944 RepID=UPI0036432473